MDVVISERYQKQPHPHPNLPLEGEGTKSFKLAHMPLPPLILRDVENADLPFCRSVFQNAIAAIFNNAGHYCIRGRMPILRK